MTNSTESKAILITGDCIEKMRELPDSSIDSIITDPPYGISFMNKEWDDPSNQIGAAIGISGGFQKFPKGVKRPEYKRNNSQVFQEWCRAWAAEAIRILKPGGHLLSFGATRTYHRMVSGIEDAGFEIRDSIHWMYGCLDDQTEIVTKDGFSTYDKIAIGDEVLCYDMETDTYRYDKVQEVFIYEYSNTAYRIQADSGEQVVTAGHRVIVERGGKKEFLSADSCEQQESVPILEDLQVLRESLSDSESYTGPQEHNLWKELPREAKDETEEKSQVIQGASELSYMRADTDALSQQYQEKREVVLQQSMQRQGTLEAARGVCEEQPEATYVRSPEKAAVGGHARRQEHILERRGDSGREEGAIHPAQDPIHQVSNEVPTDGSSRWIHSPASTQSSTDAGSKSAQLGVRPSHQSRPDGQSSGEPDVVREPVRPQEVRAGQFNRTNMVRIVPFDYVGKMWCVRVPTGAFVARRGDLVFPTGNSGMPKSHNTALSIDKMHGHGNRGRAIPTASSYQASDTEQKNKLTSNRVGPYEPITDEAKQWEGWGTGLKPAHEIIVLARKPLIGTVAKNVLEHGTGAININATKVEEQGRWPANVILDEAAGAALDNQSGQLTSGTAPDGLKRNVDSEIYGDMKTGYVDYVTPIYGDTGGASRFYYCAKPGKKEKHAGLNSDHIKHPTVKPMDLMKYLCRMVTPPDGIVLDPFMGSGTTGCAAILEGFNFIGIEQSPEYMETAKARIEHWENESNPS